MKKKSLLIVLALLLGVFVACTDKKKTEKEAATEEVEKNVEKAEKVVEEVDEAEKRKQDSIRQVKEHGHAH